MYIFYALTEIMQARTSLGNPYNDITESQVI